LTTGLWVCFSSLTTHLQINSQTTLKEKLYDINEPSYSHFVNEPSDIQDTNNPSESIRTESLNCGNQVDFTVIYNKFYPFAFFFARKFVSPEDAADIVSCIFTKFLLQKKSFTNFAHGKASLRVSVKNECLTHILNKSRRIRKENGWHYSEYQNENQCDYNKEDIGAEKLARIYEEIEKLSPRCKKVFQMAYLDNLKNEEIARLLEITVFTVKNQKSYALRALRMSLLSILTSLLFYI
jgi:RNA polymerase sigma factor (sigma-70 family)